MKNNYLLKFFINILITCAIIAGLSGLAYGQSVTIGTSSGYAPIAKNIAPGSTNNRIALFTIYSSTNVTITSITGQEARKAKDLL